GDPDRLDALDQDARLALLSRERRQLARRPLLVMGAHVIRRRLHRQHVHLGRLRLATLEAFPDRLKQEVFVVTDQGHGGTERDSVPHHDVLPRLPSLSKLFERLLENLEIWDWIEADVVALELGRVDLEV